MVLRKLSEEGGILSLCYLLQGVLRSAFQISCNDAKIPVLLLSFLIGYIFSFFPFLNMG